MGEGFRVGENIDKSTEEYGITEDDIEQIEEYLRKPMHVRDVDDLRDSSST